jgi:hypothetical protein
VSGLDVWACLGEVSWSHAFAGNGIETPLQPSRCESGCVVQGGCPGRVSGSVYHIHARSSSLVRIQIVACPGEGFLCT